MFYKEDWQFNTRSVFFIFVVGESSGAGLHLQSVIQIILEETKETVIK